MSPRLLILFAGLALPAGFAAAEPAAPSQLAGTWRFDQTRSTELSPWKTYDLTITVAGDTVTIARALGWSRRTYSDRMTLDTAKEVNVVPLDYWPDNRHLGAYVGAEKTRRIRAQWLDGRRILRLSTDLTLDTQQGPRALNILSDYKVSASGAELVLTDLRSTRHRPVVYVFKRVP
jgi:hypothetical protein